MLCVVIVNIIILGIMTGLKPVQYVLYPSAWDQFGRATEYQGSCQYNGRPEYLIPLAVINGLVLIIAVIESWQARHLSSEFQESEGIFRALGSILLVMFVGIPGELRGSFTAALQARSYSHAVCSKPVLFLVQGNPDATVFVASAVTFIFGISILLVLFVPKIVYDKQNKEKKIQGGVIVSGIKVEHPEAVRIDSTAGNISQITTHSQTSMSGEKILSNKTRQELAMENAALKKEIEHLKDGEANLQGTELPGESDHEGQ